MGFNLMRQRVVGNKVEPGTCEQLEVLEVESLRAPNEKERGQHLLQTLPFGLEYGSTCIKLEFY